MSNAKPTAAKPGNQIVVPPHANNPWSRTIRETVESIVIAFVLAFLFRTFEAEAFVIPTGSMAPTLQGRHKDIQCPQCGYSYRVSASSEVDNRTGARIAGCDVSDAECPMCGYKLKIDRNDPKLRAEYPSYNGDRIIVNKFAYDLSDPKRFDVVVFKYPEDSQVNYIKRLVGLPNEQFRIVHGDIYTAPLDSHDFTRDAKIARKSPEKLRAMLQPVYDNDYVVPKMIESGTKPRWQPWVAPGEVSPWTTSADFKSFTAENAPQQMSWIRYLNIDPVTGKLTVVEDKYAYNDGDTTGCPQRSYEVDPHWVGDLALDVQLTIKEARGSVILELVKGGHQFRCQIDLEPGENQGRAEFTHFRRARFQALGANGNPRTRNIRRELRQCRRAVTAVGEWNGNDIRYRSAVTTRTTGGESSKSAEHRGQRSFASGHRRSWGRAGASQRFETVARHPLPRRYQRRT